MATAGVLIVGGGHAGFSLAAALRSGGYLDPIRIVTEETVAPYERPPLSKDFLLGRKGKEAIAFRPERFYEVNSIELLTGIKGLRISPSENILAASGGLALAFDHLILATGSLSRRLEMARVDQGVCHGLRTIDEAQAIASGLVRANHVAIIGGGFIGLEVAAAAAAMGRRVTIFEREERLLSHAVPAIISSYLQKMHEEKGVKFVMPANIVSVNCGGDGRVRIETSTGTVTADLVILGVGAVANTEIAEISGLAVDKGILVDENLRTSRQSVYAIGDCARFPGRAGSLVRIESVQNAVDQARYLAAEFLGNSSKSGFASVPWFWSDQYDAKLQIAGMPTGSRQLVVKTDTSRDALAVASLRGDKMETLHAINAPAEFVQARKVMTAGVELTKEDLFKRGYRQFS
jgi:3-phenylpropionate/trans-cinnamate dioxygenase ferredoxin reductase subunit